MSEYRAILVSRDRHGGIETSGLREAFDAAGDQPLHYRCVICGFATDRDPNSPEWKGADHLSRTTNEWGCPGELRPGFFVPLEDAS